MVSKLESREFIRQAIAERIDELTEELFHWVVELERLDDVYDRQSESVSQPSATTDGTEGAVMFIGGH